MGLGQDITKRAPQLSLNTPGPALGQTPVGQILNCGASADATAACSALTGGLVTTANAATRALVTTQNASAAPAAPPSNGNGADYTFTATEIAG
jgi:hypothetical protein